MNAACVIIRGGTPSDWDPTTGPVAGTTLTTYAGPCLVEYEQGDGRTGDAAGQRVTVRRVAVSLPAGAQTQHPGGRVAIAAVDDNGPGGLVGRTFTVTAVSPSSHGFEQVLSCEDDQANQEA